MRRVESYDVAVVGGGPSGMMAAGRAAEKGASVILIEKNPMLGKKLLITGGGRCNVTNAEFNTKVLLSKYRNAGKYLSSPLVRWDARDTIEFFEGRGMGVKVEADNRAFPVSNSAQSVRDVLASYMKDGAVMVRNAAVQEMRSSDSVIKSVRLEDGSTICARSFILATGGKSRPETGSTGEGFDWLEKLGHKISTSHAALVPISIKDAWVGRVAGLSLRGVRITLFQDGLKQKSDIGKILFTHQGLSGPGILNMSRDIGELLQYGEVTLEIDMLPNYGYEKVNDELQRVLKENNTKKIKNSFSKIIPPSLIVPLLEETHIDPEKFCSTVTRDERVRLMKRIKHLSLSVKGLLGEKAVVTSGGVSLDDVDTKTMRSRLISNLYLVGDVLDIQRPSGGYSLQLCWTTGRIAGMNAAADVPQSASDDRVRTRKY